MRLLGCVCKALQTNMRSVCKEGTDPETRILTALSYFHVVCVTCIAASVANLGICKICPLLAIDTQAHTNTRRHTHTQARTHTHTHTRSHTHTHTHIHTHIHTRTPTDTRTHTHTLHPILQMCVRLSQRYACHPGWGAPFGLGRGRAGEYARRLCHSWLCILHAGAL